VNFLDLPSKSLYNRNGGFGKLEKTKAFEELYYELLAKTLKEKDSSFLEKLERYDTHHLDCLLHPEKHPVIVKTGSCDCCDKNPSCAAVCEFHAMHPGESGEIVIDESSCVGCAMCVQECRMQRLAASKDVIPALRSIRGHSSLVYALVAPAFLGQFSETVTPGKLRSALKAVGFDGMVEVSLLADLLTLKEALEFDANVKTAADYQLTSCCCPMWIAMIRKIYHDLVPHVPPSVSPMIAAGRMVKFLHPDAMTVFIGPCLAKKAEAREKDIAGAIDYVLTFKEIEEIFNIMEIDPDKMEESEKDHSSRAGRIYAYAGGVSEAVEQTVRRISPDRAISVKTKSASGVPACKAMIGDIAAGKVSANFFEGMGCVGGCVGGPRAIIPPEEGKKHVDAYGSSAQYPTPIDNPYVIELLHRLGLETVESLLEKSEIFTRSFE
jgi:iron only hydrogenase large subunit-like protein